MMTRFTFALLALVVCSTARSQVVTPFTLSPEGHIFFEAEINGVKGKFIFDTGAGLNVVTKRFFDKLKNIGTNGNYFTGFRATGDRIDVQLYKAERFNVGSYQYNSPYLTFLDVNWGDIDGILALKNFEDALVTIDYTKNVLVINKPSGAAALKKQARASLPIQLNDLQGVALDILCYVKINDKQVAQFVLDSGAGAGVYKVNARYLSPLGIDVLDSVKVKKRVYKSDFQAGHENAIYITRVDNLAVQADKPVTITGARTQFVEGLIYDGIMSTSGLGKKITISIPTKEILIAE